MLISLLLLSVSLKVNSLYNWLIWNKNYNCHLQTGLMTFMYNNSQGNLDIHKFLIFLCIINNSQEKLEIHKFLIFYPKYLNFNDDVI